MTQYFTAVQERLLTLVHVPLFPYTVGYIYQHTSPLQTLRYNYDDTTGGIAITEGEGFEPPRLSPNCFQDSRYRPLSHPSKTQFKECVLIVSFPIRASFVIDNLINQLCTSCNGNHKTHSIQKVTFSVWSVQLMPLSCQYRWVFYPFHYNLVKDTSPFAFGLT